MWLGLHSSGRLVGNREGIGRYAGIRITSTLTDRTNKFAYPRNQLALLRYSDDTNQVSREQNRGGSEKDDGGREL